MPRIPRAEGQTSTQIASMPNLVGEGWTAPARATQQLGQGIQKLASAFEGLADQQEEEHLHEARIAALNLKNQFDLSEIESQSTYQGDGKDYAQNRSMAWGQQLDAYRQKYASAGPKVRRFVDTFGATATGQVVEGAARFGRTRWEGTLYSQTEQAAIGELSKLAMPSAVERYKADPSAFEKDFETATTVVEQMINAYPADPGKKRQIANTAAQQLKALLGENNIPTEAKIDAVRKKIDALGSSLREGAAVGPQSGIGGVNIEPSGDMAIVKTGSGARLRVSQSHAERFAGLVADLESRGIKIDPDQTGGYANRNIRGTNTRSRHADGEAIDLNWTDNARGAPGQLRRQLGEKTINELAAKWGLKWGGNWSNPDDMHFEVDREARPQARFAASAASRETGIAAELSAYSPRRKGSAMEGGYASSRPGPDGKREVRTLDDVVAGRADYVTVAGDPKFYGKTYTIPKIDYVDASGNRQTLTNVKAVVHDTGSAFRGKPEGRFDIAIARDVDEKTMAANHAAWKEGGVRFVPEGEAPEAPKPPKPLAERSLVRVAGLKGETANDASPGGPRETNTIPGTQVAQAGPVPSGQPSYVRTELLKDLMPMVKGLEQKFLGEVVKGIESVNDRANKGVLPTPDEIVILQRKAAKVGDPKVGEALSAAVDKAQRTHAMKALPPSVLALDLAALNASIARNGGSPEAVKQQQATETLYKTMTAELEKDPFGWATEAGVIPPSPSITAETFGPPMLANRASEVEVIRRTYGDQYVQYFRPEEQKALTTVLDQGGEQMIAATGMIVEAFGPNAKDAMGEIAKDRPEAAMLGSLVVDKVEHRVVTDLAMAIEARKKRKPGDSVAPPYDYVAGRMFDKYGAVLTKVESEVRDRVIHAAQTLYDYRIYGTGQKVDPKVPDNKVLDQALADMLGENTVKGVKYGGLAGDGSGPYQSKVPVHVPAHIRQDKFFDLMGALRNSDFAWTPANPEMTATSSLPATRPAPRPQQDLLGPAQESDFAWTPTKPGEKPKGYEAPENVTLPSGPSAAKEDAEGAQAAVRAAQALPAMAGVIPDANWASGTQMGAPVDINGRPMRWASIVSRGTFVNVGDGKYAVAMADPHGDDPRWVLSSTPGKDREGRFIIDIKQWEPLLRQRVPDAFRPY